MRASGPLKLRIFIKEENHDEATDLAETVRARAAEHGLCDLALAQDAGGPVIEIAGDEAALRRFWSIAADLRGLGLMVLSSADDRRPGAAPVAQ